MQVTKATQKKGERNKNVLLSIIYIIKTIGRIVIPVRGYRETVQMFGEPSGHGELGNFVELVDLTISQGNASLE